MVINLLLMQVLAFSWDVSILHDVREDVITYKIYKEFTIPNLPKGITCKAEPSIVQGKGESAIQWISLRCKVPSSHIVVTSDACNNAVFMQDGHLQLSWMSDGFFAKGWVIKINCNKP